MGRAVNPSEGSRGESLSLALSNFKMLSTFLGSWPLPPPSNTYFRSLLSESDPPLTLTSCLPLIRTLVMTWAHLGHPGSSPLLKYAGMSAGYRVTSTGPSTQDVGDTGDGYSADHTHPWLFPSFGKFPGQGVWGTCPCPHIPACAVG